MKITPKQLKNIRLKLNLTQAELAKKLFFNSEHISRLENGSKPIMPRTEAMILQLAKDAGIEI